MKLRNKKTGEIVEAESCNSYPGTIGLFFEKGRETDRAYETLAELNAEWEDYSPAERKPRRYRLLKDLPTFNKGDEFYIAQTGALWYDGGGDDDVCAYATQTLMRFPNILEDWFEPIEDSGPLIKDEKIRKVVRAWAEINSIEEALYAESRTLCCFNDMGIGDFAIEFVGWIPTLKDGGEYAIAELCGEEEE